MVEMISSVRHTLGHMTDYCRFTLEREAGRESFVGSAGLPKYTLSLGGSNGRIHEPFPDIS